MRVLGALLCLLGLGLSSARQLKSVSPYGGAELGRQLLSKEYPRVETILGQQGDDPVALYSYSGFWGVVTVPEQHAIYFTRDNSYVVEKFDWDTGKVSYVSGELGNNGDAVGSFSEAKYDIPRYITYAPDQNALFVADTMNVKIKKLDLNKQEVTVAAGDGDTGYIDGDAQKAAFASSNSEGGPQSLVYLDGALYAADSNNKAIRKLADGQVSTLASLSFKPWHLAVDPANKYMYIAEREGHQIYALDINSCTSGNCDVSVIAGRSGTSDIIDGQGLTKNGEPGDAAFSKIKALAYDYRSCTLYAGEYRVIRAIDTSSATKDVTTVAGSKATAGYKDGADSRVQGISGMTVNYEGNLIFADRGNARVRQVLFN